MWTLFFPLLLQQGYGGVVFYDLISEVGIYKRKQESKKTRKQELDQESDQEKKK